MSMASGCICPAVTALLADPQHPSHHGQGQRERDETFEQGEACVRKTVPATRARS